MSLGGLAEPGLSRRAGFASPALVFRAHLSRAAPNRKRCRALSHGWLIYLADRFADAISLSRSTALVAAGFVCVIERVGLRRSHSWLASDAYVIGERRRGKHFSSAPPLEFSP